MADDFKLDFHPDAQRSFNDRAESLVSELVPTPPRKQAPTSYRPDIFPIATFTDQDITGEIQLGLADFFGKEVARYFRHGDKSIGLIDSGFRKLVEIAEGMQRTKQFRDTASVQCLVDLTFEWVRKRFERTTSIPLTEYVLRECEKQVENLEIWLPIFRLHVQSEFRIGKIEIKSITRGMLEEWHKRLASRIQAEQFTAQQTFARERMQLQGSAAATIRLFAEPIRAYEIAYEEAEASLALLRFFHPANVFPQARCFCVLLGRENMETTTYLMVEDAKIQQKYQKAVYGGRSAWKLDNKELSEIRGAGLDVLSELLGSMNRTEFENELLDSLFLYSRNTLEVDAADKLVYIFAALESILLKDKSEPIQQNIADRVALLFGATTDERLAISKNVKEAYNLRSRFLHHGRRMADLEIVTEFMKNAWKAFSVLINNAKRFDTRQKLIAALERRKMA